MQRFIIRWRVWLTQRLMSDWLNDRAYYRGQFIDRPIDNPDQRIQRDIDAFTALSGGITNTPANGTAKTLLFGAVQSVVSVVSFAVILWNLSFPITFFGLRIPRALFWIVIVYVVVASVVAFGIGRPLIRLSFRNEQLNALFRYALVRLRDAGGALGFYRGERDGHVELNRRFAAVITNYRRYLRRDVIFTGFNVAVSQPIGLLPFQIQAPRLFAGTIKLGAVMQSTQAFGTVQDSLSFFRNAYDLFASYRASILRLHGLVESNDMTRRLPQLQTVPSVDNSVELDEVEVRTPNGIQLVEPLNLRLDPGASMVIVGRSGTGKTTLLRTELPDTVVVSVSHRNTVEPHHERQSALLGDGARRIGKVGEQPASA
jgi:vitamin B12/bleomycin/antimicrobial peptide transport system ATP-binding/permease protein